MSVILDGENCWEHYPEGGVPFLRALYELLHPRRADSPVKLGDICEANPPRDTLPHLFAGSWINHNFAIWIGHEEDNAAWDALHRTREYLRKGRSRAAGQGAGVSGHIRPRRLRLLFSGPGRKSTSPRGATGSGGMATITSAPRTRCSITCSASICKTSTSLLGDTPPPELSRPINAAGSGSPHTLPRALSGRQDRRPGDVLRMDQRRPLRLPERTRHDGHGERAGRCATSISASTASDLFVRVDFDQPAKTALRGLRRFAYRLRGATRCASCGFSTRAEPTQSWQWHVATGKPVGAGERHRDRHRRIAECSIPFER